MTQTALNPDSPNLPPPDATVVAKRRPARSYVQGVLLDTLASTGAKVGLAWLGLLGFLAIFAPLLANSHPVVMKTADGRVSSPLLEHLTWADVSLLVLFVVAVVLLVLRRLSTKLRWMIFAASVVLTVALAYVFVQTPRAVVYERYRVAMSMSEKAGETEASTRIVWAVHTPIPYSPSDRMRDRPDPPPPLAPSLEHLMGTERTGADVLSRMIHASRIAIAVGFIATSIALVVGVIVGGLMGFFSGIVDLLGMRVVEVFSAIPTLFLLLSFVAFFPRNLYIMMVIIGLTGWVGYCRFIRAEFLKLRQQDFVTAAKASGLPLRSILFRHMLPNGVAPVLVEASFGVASAILYESTLSFLGLGLIDEPSWGQMLSQATSAGGGFYWWIATFPGLAIFLTVYGFTLVGEAMRDAIDPHTRKA